MDNPELEGLVLSLWRRRNEANAIRDITASLAKLIKDPAALDAVEFYLPQFAHMIIQLGDALPEVSELEKFLLSVCQMSVHLALQFFWIVYASLQEHRPKKPGSNRSIYTRCAKLLLRLEQLLLSWFACPWSWCLCSLLLCALRLVLVVLGRAGHSGLFPQ